MLLSPAGTWLSIPTAPGPLRWRQSATQGVCRQEGCTSYFMLKINLQRHGLTPADFACSRMKHLGWGNPAQKALLWKPCLADQGSVQGPKAGWERASKGAAAWPQNKSPGLPLPPSGYFQLRSPPAGKPQANETSYLKGLLESSMEWISFGFGAHLGVNLRGLFYGLKEEEAAKNCHITAMTVGAERRTQGLA